MSKGGDWRPLAPAHDRALELAPRLIAAMRADPSRQGRAFNAEFTQLYEKWRRLIRFLALHPFHPDLPLGGPSGVDEVEQYFTIARMGVFRWYPRPRPLTAEEEAESFRRKAIAEQRHRHFLLRVGLPTTHSHPEYARSQAVLAALDRWVVQVWTDANPGRQRLSRRLAVRRYYTAVEAFCRRWRLDTWWAVPHVIMQHFASMRGHDLAEPFVIGRPRATMMVPLVVGVPGRDAESFERDRTRFLSPDAEFVFTTEYKPAMPQVPHRIRDFLAVQEAEDASCVVILWGGQSWFHCCETEDCEDEAHVGGVAHLAAWCCERRLGRSLTYREQRAVKSELTPQLRAARGLFLNSDWAVIPQADLDTHLQWLARRLLDPSLSFTQIVRDEWKRPGVVLHEDTVRHACDALAETLAMGSHHAGDDA